MPYDLQEIEKCVRDRVVWIPPCYACAYCNKNSTCMSMRTFKGLLYIKKKKKENLLKCLTQEYATSILDPTLKRHLDPTGKYVQISLQIQVSLY